MMQPQNNELTSEENLNLLIKNECKCPQDVRLCKVKLTLKQMQQLLDRNIGNIPPSAHKIDDYAYQMRNGLWRYNGDSLRFSTNGHLLDGQNRLNAALLAGHELVTDLCFGLDEECFKTIDVGRVRNAGHMVYRQFAEKLKKSSDGAMLARSVRKIILHDAGYSQNAALHRIAGEKMRIDDQVIFDYINQNPVIFEQIEYVKARFQSDCVIPRATVLYVLHIGARYDDQYAKAFIAKAFGGESLKHGEPCYHLYNFLRRIKQKDVRWTPAEIEATIIKVWNLTARKGVYTIKQSNQIKAKLEDKVFVMKRPDETIRDQVKRPFLEDN